MPPTYDSTRDEIIFDAWTPLSFKRSLGNKRVPSQGYQAPQWVGDHARRIQAYRILQAIADNAGRHFLGTDSQAVKDALREYGDADLIVETVLAALIGDDQSIVVEGAEDFDPNAATAAGVEGEAQGVEQQAATTGSQSTDAELQARAEAAAKLQDWLGDWADKERLPLKIIENERNAVKLGDGVYTLGWSAEKQRARLRVFDPGFYFPVLDDGNEDDYPSKVHLAWELATDDLTRRTVRRITWELVDLPDGGTQTLPWNDGPTTKTCLFSDATWVLDMARGATVEDLSEGAATYNVVDGIELNRVDLEIDFVPVVHVPNTVAILNHYGRSTISAVAQALADLAAADTDLQASSATTGKPPLALSGASLDSNATLTYKAGDVWQLGPDGKLTALDTSDQLRALMEYVVFLLERISVNGRVPAAVLGRVKPSEVPSGVALALSFGPLEQMVKQMRLVRFEKYQLLLKFAHRIALANGQEDVPKQWMPSVVRFGAHLPSDQATAVQQVKDLLEAKAISLETAVLILLESGFPIEDANEEVRRIEERDFEGANELLDATGSPESVQEYLGSRFTVGPNQPAQQGSVGTAGTVGSTPVNLPAPQPEGTGNVTPPAQ